MRILALLSFFTILPTMYAQISPSDACGPGVPVLSVNGSCIVNNFTLDGAFANGGILNASCAANLDRDDGWYQFVALSMSTSVFLAGDRTHLVAAYSGSCGTGELACDQQDAGTDAIIMFPTSIGSTYYIQVHRRSGNNTASMNGTICVVADFSVNPGGIIGSSIWYKANGSLYSDPGVTLVTNSDLVYQWNDQGANSLHLDQSNSIQRPTYASVGANYNPWVSFDRSSSIHLDKTFDFSLAYDLQNNTLFLVNEHISGAVWAQWESPSNARIGLESSPSGTNTRFDFPSNAVANVTSGSVSVLGRTALITGHADNSLDNSIYVDGVLDITQARSTLTCTGGNGQLTFGASGWSNSYASTCNFSEYLVFPSALTNTDRVKVESYLAIKYGITLLNTGGGSMGDYVATSGTLIWDASINPVYHNDVIGIGRDDVELLEQKQSHTLDDTTRIYISTLVNENTLNTGSFVNNISYVTIGHNTGEMCATIASNMEIPVGLPNCALYSRLEREWKLTKTNFAQTFNGDFTLNNCAFPLSVNIADLRLLVDDDGDFSNGGTQCYYNGDGTGVVISYSSPVITVSNISGIHIPDNTTKYITLASIDPSTPLPVELINFNTECQNEIAALSWQTASEANNDFFAIERSRDGLNFEEIARIDGEGTSSTMQSYDWTDYNPLPGLSYYRLNQVDFDGKNVFSDTRVLNCEINEILVFPNPFDQTITISLNSGLVVYPLTVSLYDNLGRLVHDEVFVEKTQLLEINLGNKLAAGHYSIIIKNQKIIFHEKLLKLQ